MISKKELFAILDKRIKTLMDDPYIDPSSRADRLKEIKVLRNDIESIPDDQPDLLPFQWPIPDGMEVVTRDGRKVEQLVRFENLAYSYVGVIEGEMEVECWIETGEWFGTGNENDLFLRRKEKKVWVVEYDDEIGVATYDSLEAARANTAKGTTIYEATLKPVV